jgi:hypothetical protein
MRTALLLVVLPILLFGAKDHAWKTGKVLDSATAKTYVPAGATTTTNASTSGSGWNATTTATSQTRIQQMEIRDTQLLIVSDEFAYVVEDTRKKGGGGGPIVPGAIAGALANRHHGCRFIVGDDVKFYQDKASLHVIDTDGKECKVEVLRQERLR